MAAPRELIRLVETFGRNIESYKSGHYNEAQVRREFIDPLFELLGWDITNRQGNADAYKDVIHEDAIKIGGAAKAPDYCFRIGGTRKFFLEAKKPSINIRDDVSPAFQLRRYAWTAKLPLSILTDFEEFAAYDCRVKPVKTDRAATARTLYFPYKEYPEHWDKIYSIFSRDAVLKGSFDKYADSHKAKKGTAAVDEAFLKDVELWRDMLARNIARQNLRLTQRELNVSVQSTIDRIIFLRICEDRGIEDYGRLMALQNGTQVYQRLCKLFRDADARYNSGIFHFNKEKDRPTPHDELTLRLKIDDKVLKDIFKGLYYPESPYEFSVLSADILGQVYEQFLGKVIRLTSGHQAKVEYKPEVKKAGGVYYTPTYIVDYIVKNTVGKLLEGKKPGVRGGGVSKLKILDPACGSGSFLLGAYQYLLDWHRDKYVDDSPKKHKKVLYQAAGGEWRLTTAERKRILLNNIYGVDIDPQAVEVTKLSLLLKVLEGESSDTLERQLKLFRERALPDLGGNVKCGNSLIGPDFYQNEQLDLFDEEERYRVNAFDWQAEFPEIIKSGGFDIVIGNPPYIPIETMMKEERRYYQEHYSELERKYDSSIVFILALLAKVKPGGLLGYISSLTWQTGENFEKLRKHLFTEVGVDRIVNLPFDVFKAAYVDTCVYVLSKKPRDSYLIYRFPKKLKGADMTSIPYIRVNRNLVQKPAFKVVLEPNAQRILLRVSKNNDFKPLGDFTISTQGLASNLYNRVSKPLGNTYYPFLEKGQVYRYRLVIENTTYTDMSTKQSLAKFYEATPKILIRRVVNRQDRLMATYTKKRIVFKKDVNPFVTISKDWSPVFVLGVLNSRLISYLYVNTSSISLKDDFRQTTLAELRRLPISVMRGPKYSGIILLVERMLELNKKLQKAKTEHDKTVLKRQIDSTDAQIDNLVYELYGLTKKEIALVEESVK